ncbi:MAG: hypothetical protein K1X64_12875 [Myxococcaceae bacterium]|nr:hypothetical protein [Myxococcaceae bacterium]
MKQASIAAGGLLFAALAACGIKAPPRPPLEAPVPVAAPALPADAGCCQEPR